MHSWKVDEMAASTCGLVEVPHSPFGNEEAMATGTTAG